MSRSSDPAVSGLELWQWRQEARAAAIAANVPVEELDWLLLSVSDLDKLALRLDSYKGRGHIPLNRPLAQLKEQWQQRIQNRVPVQYLAGVTPWRNFSLGVSPGVLIPRPETEWAIDLALNAAQSESRPHPDTPLTEGDWADLGTGSGAIALGLAEVLPNITLHAVDRSEEALAIAQENALNLGYGDRIHFYCGSWFEPLHPFQGLNRLRGIISNPPYIPTALLRELEPEVAHHEPAIALDGGPDGLDCIRHLIATAPTYLSPGGILLLEMMAGQAPAVTELLQDQGSYTQIEIFSDLAGIERFARAYRS
ncbi:peptide chain release factor N(5)-glutamine methyltransferase [Oscillatoria sp. HE19RPO]|uniref:peptide chain release factor N(5)-glutamine methyltransferase n=1 Tax=Oscillatoria sp. HE19RPO TaxID=2954806 RepID=UPI0020C46B16|nr:peptide chain release factor N(5)-glutamine methyltransferase [Oscillatoria sp. HE19RPO]